MTDPETLLWPYLAAGFAAPWLRVVLAPRVSAYRAGLWAITVIGVGMVGIVLAGAALRLAADLDTALVPPVAAMAAALVSVGLLLSALCILGVAALGSTGSSP